MPTRNINLTEHLDRFVARQIKGGQFRNASEVMRAGLRLLEQSAREEREKLALLRALANEAFDQLDQGRGIAFEGEKDLTAFVEKIGRRAAMRTKQPLQGD